MKPSVGRIVRYVVADQDMPYARGALNPMYGNPPMPGDDLAAMIVRTFGSAEDSAVNLQVFMDGPAVFWVRSAIQGDMPGQWRETPRV